MTPLHANVALKNESDASLWNNESLRGKENKWLNEREMQVNMNVGFKIYTSKFHMVGGTQMKSHIIISEAEMQNTLK